MKTSLLPKEICGKLEKIQRDFIWGSLDRNRAAHPLAWDNFCIPKKEGGLGLRRMHYFNKSLVMKLGWGLTTNPNALWARVVRDKYGCGSRHLPRVQKRGVESHIWRAIRNTWSDLQQIGRASCRERV